MAANGKDARYKVAVWVDATTSPFGRWTSKEDYASRLPLQWAFAIRKCSVILIQIVMLQLNGVMGYSLNHS
jgi:hypothetical protein